jgi:hypothetical protein
MTENKQEQTVKGGSVAIQANRDVLIQNGLSPTEVVEICTTLFRNNFPLLREEANRTALDSVNKFGLVLEKRIIDKIESIAFERLREPDVQASINDAVMANARKDTNAHPDLLSALIVERISKHPSDFKDLVISEAVKVVPLLTATQIAFLSFLHFVAGVTFKGLKKLSELELIGQKALEFSSPGFNLSLSQKMHIEYAGACSFIHLGGLSTHAYKHLMKVYSQFSFANDLEFATALQSEAPSFSNVIHQFQTEGLGTFHLTSVGQAIAIANISNYIKLDYSEWLK